MKRLLLLLTVLSATIAASGQTPSGMRFGLAGYPFNAGEMFDNGRLISTVDLSTYFGDSPDFIYDDYYGSTYSTGTLSFEYVWRAKGGYDISLNAGLNLIWKKSFDALTNKKKGTESGAAIYCIPMFRFYLMEKRAFSLYTGAGVGLTWYAHFREVDIATVRPAIQLTPIGVTAGEKVYFFAELGLGAMYLGGKTGIGIRF